MLTPELYYEKYKKISQIFNKYLTNTLFFFLLIILFLIFITNNLELIIPTLLILYTSTFISVIIIFKLRINKLKKLTDDKNINRRNYHKKLEMYSLVILETILSEYNIDINIYNNFYREQLKDYYNRSRNILTDKPYMTFMFGAIFVGFVNTIFRIVNSPEILIIKDLSEYFSITFIMLFASVIFILLLSLIIYASNDLFNRSKEISKLIYYTEIIFNIKEKYSID